MSDFKEKLAQPYRQDCQSLEEHANYAQQLPLQITPNLQELPTLIDRIQKGVLPYWVSRANSLEERLKPLDLSELKAAKERLGRVNRIAWLAPEALRIRVLNACFRIVITSVILIQLGVIVGLLYLLVRLIWYLA